MAAGKTQAEIDKLELKTYLRGYVPCSIDAISLEDVIVIRLGEGVAIVDLN